jgi:hypothetical protein
MKCGGVQNDGGAAIAKKTRCSGSRVGKKRDALDANSKGQLKWPSLPRDGSEVRVHEPCLRNWVRVHCSGRRRNGRRTLNRGGEFHQSVQVQFVECYARFIKNLSIFHSFISLWYFL